MITPAYCETFAVYNQWMNEKIYADCATMSDEARKRDQRAFFGSIHSTLNHLYFGDSAWMNRLAQRTYPIKPIGEDYFDAFDALREARTRLDADILEWSRNLAPEDLAQTLTWKSGVDGQTRDTPLWVLAANMFNHQTHHRGQVTTLLSQMGRDIGSTDLPRMPAWDQDGALSWI